MNLSIRGANLRVLLSLVLAQPYNLLCKRSHRLNLGKTRNGELEEKKMLFVRSKSSITVDDIPDNKFVNKVTLYSYTKFF